LPRVFAKGFLQVNKSCDFTFDHEISDLAAPSPWNWRRAIGIERRLTMAAPRFRSPSAAPPSINAAVTDLSRR
jgi:hypothetical protein